MRDKIKKKSNKVNVLNLRSLEVEEKELLEQLDEHKKALKIHTKKKNKKEKELSEEKTRLKSLNETLRGADLEGQKFKEQLSNQNKRRATLKVVPAIILIKYLY